MPSRDVSAVAHEWSDDGSIVANGSLVMALWWLSSDLTTARQWSKGSSMVVLEWLGGGSVVAGGPKVVQGWLSCGPRWLGGSPGIGR